MTDEKSSRRELLRPLHLLGIALVCGVFASGVTFVSTGAFTARVNETIASGSYEGLTPIALGLVVGGVAFIATLLILSILILAVDPTQFESKTMDRPVLYDAQQSGDGAAPSDGAAPAPDAADPAAGSTEPPASDTSSS